MHKRITLARVLRAVERASRTTDNPGFCIECGAAVEGVEPDARKDRCEQCGRPGVYGAEEILMLVSR